jgi:hypothetical protein
MDSRNGVKFAEVAKVLLAASDYRSPKLLRWPSIPMPRSGRMPSAQSANAWCRREGDGMRKPIRDRGNHEVDEFNYSVLTYTLPGNVGQDCRTALSRWVLDNLGTPWKGV